MEQSLLICMLFIDTCNFTRNPPFIFASGAQLQSYSVTTFSWSASSLTLLAMTASFEASAWKLAHIFCTKFWQRHKNEHPHPRTCCGLKLCASLSLANDVNELYLAKSCAAEICILLTSCVRDDRSMSDFAFASLDTSLRQRAVAQELRFEFINWPLLRKKFTGTSAHALVWTFDYDFRFLTRCFSTRKLTRSSLGAFSKKIAFASAAHADHTCWKGIPGQAQRRRALEPMRDLSNWLTSGATTDAWTIFPAHTLWVLKPRLSHTWFVIGNEASQFLFILSTHCYPYEICGAGALLSLLPFLPVELVLSIVKYNVFRQIASIPTHRCTRCCSFPSFAFWYCSNKIPFLQVTPDPVLLHQAFSNHGTGNLFRHGSPSSWHARLPRGIDMD